MKKRLGLFWFALALMAWGPVLHAQYNMGVPAGAYGAQGNFQQAGAEYQAGLPGRVWFRTNLADQGLGYRGSYLTLGGKTRLFDDFLDGRWLGESNVHFSLESNRFFGNLGVSRVFSVQSAGADFTLGGWVDIDDDRQGNFAHTFSQLGLNGSIKTRRWDIIGNGYFPVGDRNHSYGLDRCFEDNVIVIIPGIDTALKGFDVTLRTRPQALAMVNGHLDLGGYGYQSELVDAFGGGRARLGFQILQGMMINAEVNYDDRFKTTGVLQMGFMFGANARGNEHSYLARDLEPTLRNDHIVRYQRDFVLAIDPDTGRPYNVLHVDNTADPAFSDGRVQTPFARLIDAQNASVEDDIIFVRHGTGTTFNYNQGIVLKDGQMLLGDGAEHLIPIQNGQFFLLCNDLSFPNPVITAQANGAAVTLANRNTVRGFVMDGSNGEMAYGIYGDGFAAGSPLRNGLIEDNEIRGAILHGVYVNELAGNWEFNRNIVRNNGFDGIFLENAVDPTSVFRFEDNLVFENGRDGIHMENYDATRIAMIRNLTNNNNRDGVRLVNHLNTPGTGTTVDIFGHEASGNTLNGVHVNGGSGNLTVLNSEFANNGGAGLRIVDWTDGLPGTRTFIGETSGVTSFTGNGVGISIDQNVGSQTVVIDDITATGNITGVRVAANGVASTVNTTLRNSLINANAGDGAQFASTLGAAHFVNLTDNVANGNGNNGLRFLVGDNSGTPSSLTARLDNMTVNGNFGDGIFTQVFNDGLVDFRMTQSTVIGSGVNGMRFLLNNDEQGFINRIAIEESIVSGSGANGLIINTADGTSTDVLLVNSDFSGNGANGVSVRAEGDGILGPDNFTRVTMNGNTMDGNGLDGVTLQAFGDARLLANLQSNTATGNGLSGIAIEGFNDAVVNARLSNNLATDVFVETNNRAEINAIFVENAFGDGTFINDVTGTMCLAFSNNFFAVTPPTFINNSAPVFFRIELDGATNGFQNGDIGPGFTFGPFGSVCEPLVSAEEFAFQLQGF